MRRSKMRTVLKSLPAISLSFVASIIFSGVGVAADTHVIKATSSITWMYNGKSSKTDGTPLVVDDLRVGDIIDVQVDPGIPHGLITIKQHAKLLPSENETK